MSKFTFECFVCDETLTTNSTAAVVEFDRKHKDCSVREVSG